MEDFYTYIYYDPTRNYEPFYVGKGSGSRAFQKKNAKVEGRIRRIKEARLTHGIGIYAGMSEEDAFLTEGFFVWKYGRKDQKTGPLLNLCDGGKGGTRKSEETKEKIRAKRKRQVFSESAKEKQRAALKQCCGNRKRTHITNEHKKAISVANKGKAKSEETKSRMSAASKGKLKSDEHRAKMSAAMKGRKSPRKGVSLSEESKEKLALANIGKKWSQTSIAKRSATRAANRAKKLAGLNK